MEKPRILIIEDDDLQAEIYEEALGHYELFRARTGREALAVLPKVAPHLIILDHILDDGDLGLDYLPELKEAVPHVPVIVISGAMDVQEQLEALQGPRRAHYCLSKPVDLDELRDTLQTALRECGETEIVKSFESLERSRRADIHELLSRSTDRLSRQNEILRIVKDSSARPNISALARRFNVARRTIIRDLHELIRRGQLPAEVYPRWDTEGDEVGEPGPSGSPESPAPPPAHRPPST
ncbi:MAG: response regulator [Verrucomicrobiales bacterium]|nr:response regulator [Verrucomicrobiales bacterium]